MYTFKDLNDIISKLRSPGGCPWDIEQTHESLISCLHEESYEVTDAILKNDKPHLKEELGDLLLQVIFHSQIAKEDNEFTIDDVINDICEKMIRRHPHVFADVNVKDSNEVIQNWENIKKNEKKETDEFTLDKIPKHFPPLLKAYKLQKKASSLGFDWSQIEGPLSKLDEEILEFKEAIKSNDKEAIEDELGDILFSIVNVGRFYKVLSDQALDRTNRKFHNRFNYIEKKLKENNKDIKNMTLEELDKLWEEAKKQ